MQIDFNGDRRRMAGAAALALAMLGLFAGFIHMQGTREVFEYPDIREEFCGIEIPAAYCQCAFHNNFCGDIGLSRGAAETHVYEAYSLWVAGLIDRFARACVAGGSIWYRPDRACITCDPGYLPLSGSCVLEEEYQTVQEQYDLPDVEPRPPAPEYQPPQIRVVQPEGEIFIYVSAFNQWKGPIRGEALMRPGDRLRTGVDGAARVIFDNRAGARDTVDVAPNTVMDIPSRPEPEPGFWVDLWDGIIEIYDKLTGYEAGGPQPAANFNVRTPTVVVGTRGTDFIVRHDAGEDFSFVVVNEGEVDVTLVDVPGSTVVLQPLDSLVGGGGELTVAQIEPGAWEQVLLDHGLPKEKFDAADVVFPDTIGPPIDPDLVFPQEAADDPVGDLADVERFQEGGGPAALGVFLAAALVCCCGVVLLGAGGFLFIRARRNET